MLYSRTLLFIHSLYTNLHLLIPIPQSFPCPPIPPLSVALFVTHISSSQRETKKSYGSSTHTHSRSSAAAGRPSGVQPSNSQVRPRPLSPLTGLLLAILFCFAWKLPQVCWYDCVLLLRSYLTLCNPMVCSLPGSSADRLLQARILEWVATPSSRGSSQPRDQTHVSYVSCIIMQVRYQLHNLGSLSSWHQLLSCTLHGK